MGLIAHDQKADAFSHRYSIQTEDGDVWLLFDVPDNSPLKPSDVALALEALADCKLQQQISVLKAEVEKYRNLWIWGEEKPLGE